MGATSDFTLYSDRFCDYSGASGREFASQLVSRRPHWRGDLQMDPIGYYGTDRVGTRARTAAEECVVRR